MPAQDFRAAPPSGPAREPATARVLAARLIAFGGAALITAIGFWQITGTRCRAARFTSGWWLSSAVMMSTNVGRSRRNISSASV